MSRVTLVDFYFAWELFWPHNARWSDLRGAANDD